MRLLKINVGQTWHFVKFFKIHLPKVRFLQIDPKK